MDDNLCLMVLNEYILPSTTEWKALNLPISVVCNVFPTTVNSHARYQTSYVKNKPEIAFN